MDETPFATQKYFYAELLAWTAGNGAQMYQAGERKSPNLP
jgi:hypothetical protein